MTVVRDGINKVAQGVLKTKKTLRQYKHNKIRSDNLINYLNNNTLGDWLNKKTPSNVSTKLVNVNVKFKDCIYHYISTKCNDMIICNTSSLTPNAFETLTAMKEQHQVIANACLIDRSEGILEYPDLLVRSDYVTVLFPYLKTLDNKLCYVIINFYNDTLKIDLSGQIIDRRYLELRQYMQNKVLYKYRQSFTADHSDGLIIARNCKHNNKIYTDYVNQVKIIKGDGTTYTHGRQWLNNLNTNYLNWSALPKPTVPELYANAKIPNKEILDIAREQDDITLLWKCTVTQRALAHDKDIFCTKTLLNADKVNFNNQEALILNRLLSASNSAESNTDVRHNKKDYVILHMESINCYEYIEANCIGTTYVYAGACKHKGSVTKFGLGCNTTEDFSPIQIEKQLAIDLHAYLSELLLSDNNLYIYTWKQSSNSYFKMLEAKYKIPLHTDFHDHLFDIHDYMIKYNKIVSGMHDFTLFSISHALNIPYNYDKPVELAETLTHNNTQQAVKIIEHITSTIQLIHAILTNLYLVPSKA